MPSLKQTPPSSRNHGGRTGGKYLKPSAARSARFKSDLGKVTAQLGRQIEGQLSKVAFERERRVIGLEVILDGGRIRVGKPKISDPLKERGTRTAAQKFDPHEAGRKAVEQMQQAEGGSWTGAELGERYRLSAANLHKRRAEHRIVWWKDARNQFHYPKWQFTLAGTLLRGIQEVLQGFHSTDEWRVMRYFLGAREQLRGRTPLDLLRNGEVEEVMAHAKRHGEENTW